MTKRRKNNASSNTVLATPTSRRPIATTQSKLSLYPMIIAATAAVIILQHIDMPITAANNNDPTPPKSPAPMVAAPRAANDNQKIPPDTVFGGPTGISGAGHANFMTGPLPGGDTMKWVKTSKGKRFRVNPAAAAHLLGFVNALEAAGAPITEIGGYTPRHIAGSARWSQHAYGNAIDIDQISRNKVRAPFGMWAKSHPQALREAARKHGIISGGDWRDPADFGHFEWSGSSGGAGGGDHTPASIRFNNPGAQYPADWAKAFGMDGYGVIGGGHLIAQFPDPVGGAAANMYLLNKSYASMKIGAAGTKWTGGNGFGVPGYDANKELTHELLNDPAFMIPFMKAIARREAGHESPLTDDQWMRAFKVSKLANMLSASSRRPPWWSRPPS